MGFAGIAVGAAMVCVFLFLLLTSEFKISYFYVKSYLYIYINMFKGGVETGV